MLLVAYIIILFQVKFTKHHFLVFLDSKKGRHKSTLQRPFCHAIASVSSLIRRTIASIQQVVGSMYDEKQIEKACKQIAAGIEVSSIADSDFIQRVFARLQSQKQKKSPRRKAPSHEDLLNAVLGNT